MTSTIPLDVVLNSFYQRFQACKQTLRSVELDFILDLLDPLVLGKGGGWGKGEGPGKRSQGTYPQTGVVVFSVPSVLTEGDLATECYILCSPGDEGVGASGWWPRIAVGQVWTLAETCFSGWFLFYDIVITLEFEITMILNKV